MKKQTKQNNKNMEQQERKPDCVTELRKGNKVVTVRGFFDASSKESAVDKIERLIRNDGEASGF